MDTKESDDSNGLRLLAEFRENLTGAPTDATDRMRHTVLNATMHGDAAAKEVRPIWTRRFALSSAAVVVTGLVAVVAVIGVVGRHSTTPNAVPPAAASKPAAKPAGPSAAQLQDVAYVKAQTIEALGDLSSYVSHTHSTYIDGGSSDTWSDASTGRYRYDQFNASGVPTLSSAVSISGGQLSDIVVDFVAHEWWQGVTSATGNGPDPGTSDDPSKISDALADGSLQLLGQEQLDGHDTLHLRLTNPSVFFAMDVWVDTVTFLPYQKTADKTGTMTATPTETDKYSWLERTPANLAHVELTPPAGYTEKTGGTQKPPKN